MEAPNAAQLEGQLRTALAAGGPIAAIILQKMGWTVGDYELYLNLFLYIGVPLIVALWSYVSKRSAALVKAAQAVPGATVVADSTASPAVKAAAASESELVKVASKVEGATVVVDHRASPEVQAVAKDDKTAPDVVTEKVFLEQKAA